MSNALTRAGHSLTLAEKRLVMMAISQLNPKKPPKFGEAPTSRVKAADYAKEYDLDLDTAYNQLKAGAKALFTRKITFFEPAHKRGGKPLSPIQIDMRWVGRATYHKGEGWIELAWWHELLPHLFAFKRQFTKYQLQQATALRSIYSWRLLELLMRFESTGRAEYTIEDFAASMDATEKQRANFNNIKRRIIEPAVKELTEKDGWIIDWEPVKAGRKVKAVKFTFRRNPQTQIPYEAAPNGDWKELDWVDEFAQDD